MKSSLVFIGTIALDGAGKPRLTLEGVDRSSLPQLLYEFFGSSGHGRVKLTFSPAPTPSDNRPVLAWLHGVFFPMVAKALTETTGDVWDAEKTKEFLKENIIPLGQDGCIPSLGDLDDEALREFVERAKDFASEWAGLNIDDDNKQKFPLDTK